MGLAARGRLAAALLALGWSARTPAAILLAASTSAAHAWRGTLAELGSAPLPEGTTAAGTLCIGEVVGLAAAIAGSPAWRTAPPGSDDGLRVLRSG
jgi:siroheme synthase